MNELSENAGARKEQEFYESLKIKLDEHHDFPEDYIFKFIFENSKQKLIELYKVFDEIRYTFSTRESVNGKYISCTVAAFMLDSDQVIRTYKEAGKIDGIIML